MKRCPKCSRTFPDENQKFCTFDGGLLRADQPAFDPNMTIRATSADLNEIPAPPENDGSEAKTSVRLGSLNETIASFGSSTFRETTPVGAQTSSELVMPSSPESAPTSLDLSGHEVPPPPSPSLPTSQPLRAQQAPAAVERPAPAAPATTAAVAQPAKKKSILPWVLAALVILLILGGAAAAAGYFLVLKPMMDAKREPVRPTIVNVNSSSTPEEKTTPANVNAAVETKKGPEPFVPPPGAVQFTNSAANLDGDLASHYVDFSFYYPKDWKKDPQSGVSGAGSFAKLDNQSTDAAYLKERVLINWYPTKGSFEADKDVFPQSANKIVDQLSKSLKNFEEVSRGETTLNTYKGYEVRFKGTFKDTGKGDLPYWGRVIFLPPGSNIEKGGVAIVMLATSLSSDVTSADDVGDKGGLALILNSFRLGSE